MNLPIDFVNRMKDYLLDEFDEFVSSYDKPEVKGIRFNKAGASPLSCFGLMDEADKDFLTDETGNDDAAHVFSQVLWEERGFIYDEQVEIAPGKHPLHEAGAYYIQEPSAMSPVHYLDPKPGDRVLDLCASPGGKSTQIAARMNGEGILISNEINGKRAQVLSENIERMGVSNALVISEDPRDISGKLAGFFDRILVDAPCSGEGMFRRSETAQNEWSLQNVAMCAERQAWILDEAAKMLAPGGTLVYSTCTFAKEEDEENIKLFIERNPEFSLAEMEVFEGMTKGFDGVGIRLYPHKVLGEGHFVCKLTKGNMLANSLDSNDTEPASGNVSEVEITKTPPVFGYESDISKKERDNLKDGFKTLKEILADEAYEKYVSGRTLKMFGDNLYALPQECPYLKGIKVVRAGLQLGTILKNRFEPAHSLAKVLVKGECKGWIGMDNTVIYKYINGETFTVDECEINSAGSGSQWKPIFINDYPIGFGKVAGNTVKNHYPKGLRKDLKR